VDLRVQRAQITFEYLDTDTGEVGTGQIRPATWSVLREWLSRFEGRDDEAMAESSVRNVGVTIACPICGQPFTPLGRQRVCSAACRQAAWRRRQGAPRSSLPFRAARAATVYECPSCDTRYLGVQRCSDCGVFCRRVGPGGLCPHCDEPVTVTDLLPVTDGI
jgi:predicted nucleic acid-binding Zn ribbon protein